LVIVIVTVIVTVWGACCTKGAVSKWAFLPASETALIGIFLISIFNPGNSTTYVVLELASCV
jgi:hypothetical protein